MMRFVVPVKADTFNWDDRLFEHGVFDDSPLLVPMVILYQGITYIPAITEVGQRFITIWVIFILVKFVDAVIRYLLSIIA